MNIIASLLLWFTYFISLYFAIFWLIVFLFKTQKPEQKELKDKPFVTIAVPAFNEEKNISGTLETLFKIDYPKDKFEIFVINDGSTDNTENVVLDLIDKNKDVNVKLLNQQNKGKGAAMNNAIRRAQGKYFVCLDADSFVDKEALTKMLPYFVDDKIGAVLPSLKVKSPKNVLQKLQWYEYIINMFYKELMGKLDCVHVTPGPFCVYSTKIIKDIGMFDEDNITEDLEIALRLQSKNYKIVQLLNTDVKTLGPSDLRSLYKQRNRWFKGATLNAIKYRRMMLNHKYGDFGMIQMPTIILSGIIAIVIISSVLYYTLAPNFKHIYHMALINFDFLTLIRAFQFDFKILDLDYVIIFVALVMLGVSLIIMKKSEVTLRERLLKHGSLPIVVYLLVYFLLLSVIWMGVLFDLVTGRRQRW